MTSCQTGEYNCPYCTRTFEVRSKLSNHLQRFHNLDDWDSKKIIRQQEIENGHNEGSEMQNKQEIVKAVSNLKNTKFRGYVLPIQTLKQLDYLALVTDKPKSQIMVDSIDFFFTMYATLPKELKKRLICKELGDDIGLINKEFGDEEIISFLVDPHSKIITELMNHLQEYLLKSLQNDSENLTAFGEDSEQSKGEVNL